MAMLESAWMDRLLAVWLAVVVLVVLSVAQMPDAVASEPRPPGTLLLNMLTKNEAEHLDRTLPDWAHIIDYWVIGIDDNNTDNSEEVINRHLSHIPGSIEVVHFDGMGPTWTKLVEAGLEKFPEATHGIIADADFRPMQKTMDKMQLDIRCSKHMFTIWTHDHLNERRMDWIYRNIPGAMVKRRAHQTLEVPKLPDQEVFQTLINLNIEESPGGYQDRTGLKNKKYIEFLSADLVDYPDDPRTLYYLGYAHFDSFLQNHANPSAEDWDHLKRSVEYYTRRFELENGNAEERWFATLKLGEINERFYRDWTKALSFYLKATEMDPERSDAWFYAGQGWRLRKEPEKGLKYLYTAATLPFPDRALFQWHHLYQCLAKLEYARAVRDCKLQTQTMIRRAFRLLRESNCGHDGAELREVKFLKAYMTDKLEQPKKKKKENLPDKRKSLVAKLVNALEVEVQNDGSVSRRIVNKLQYHIDSLRDVETGEEKLGSCRLYRRSTTPVLKFVHQHGKELDSYFGNAWSEVEAAEADVRRHCR